MSKRVFIGVGHGGSDPGAVSGSYVEADINLVMALACKAELERHGVTVGISRTRDENDRLSDEIRECNAFNPDVAIEIHNNSGGGDGFEVYTQQSAESRRLAELVQEEIWNINQNSRGIKYNAALGWTRQVKCVTVLAEGFFVDNEKDRYDTAGQQKFGAAYAHALLRYLNITIKEGKDVTKAEAKEIIKEKAGVSDATIVYLDSYRYGDDLIMKLAQAMK